MLQLFRFIAIVWRFRRQQRPLELVSQTPFTVRWLDCDAYRHMNNARYLAMMDLARMDHMFRSRMLDGMRQAGLKPVVVEVSIKYRRELKPGERYAVWTAVSHVESRKLVVSQRFVIGDRVHAEAECGMLFLRRGKVADAAAVQTLLGDLGLMSSPAPGALKIHDAA